MTNTAFAGSAPPAMSASRLRLNGHRLESAVTALSRPPRICPGTSGRWADQAFQVTGGFTFVGPAGFWREWHLRFEGGNEAWLTERDEDLTLREEVELPDSLPSFDGVGPGATCQVSGEDFVVTARQEGHRVAAHGAPGAQLDLTAQFIGLHSREAILQLDFSAGPARLYLCSRMKLADLEPSIPACAEPAPALAQLSCPACAAKLPAVSGLYAFGGCPACHAVLDLGGQQPTVLRPGAVPKARPTSSDQGFTLPVGAAANLLGSRYTVVGAVTCTAHAFGEPVAQTEYTLFSAQAGTLRLLERTDGTWWAGELSLHTPTYNSSDAWLNGAHFRLTHSYVATVAKASGSLPTLVGAGDTHQAMEFLLEGLGGGLRDGTRLVRQVREDDLSWQLYSPLEAKAVLSAFSAEAPAVRAPRRRPVAVSRTRLSDLRGPLRLTAWGNAALWTVNPGWLALLTGGAALAGILSLAWFSWLFEGERL